MPSIVVYFVEFCMPTLTLLRTLIPLNNRIF